MYQIFETYLLVRERAGIAGNDVQEVTGSSSLLDEDLLNDEVSLLESSRKNSFL